MLKNYTATYSRIPSGYMGQMVEWPEVITEGKTLDQCREMLQDALQEMIEAYRQLGKEIPQGGALFEQLSVEVSECRSSAAKSSSTSRRRASGSFAKGTSTRST